MVYPSHYVPDRNTSCIIPVEHFFICITLKQLEFTYMGKLFLVDRTILGYFGVFFLQHCLVRITSQTPDCIIYSHSKQTDHYTM